MKSYERKIFNRETFEKAANLGPYSLNSFLVPGRGRQVIAVARTADLVLMVLDSTKKDIHR